MKSAIRNYSPLLSTGFSREIYGSMFEKTNRFNERERFKFGKREICNRINTIDEPEDGENKTIAKTFEFFTRENYERREVKKPSDLLVLRRV